MSDKSNSPPPREVEDQAKVFVTNIQGSQSESTVEQQLRLLFQKYGQLTKLNVKKNKNGLYYFAFIQYSTPQEAARAIEKLDQYELFGKRMKVYLYRNFSRQDKPSQGCFHCKRSGHFARQCPQNRGEQREGDRGYRDNKDREGYRRDRSREKERDNRGRYDREDRGSRYRNERGYSPRRRSYSGSPSDRRRRRDLSSESRSPSYDRRNRRHYEERRYEQRRHDDRHYKRRNQERQYSRH